MCFFSLNSVNFFVIEMYIFAPNVNSLKLLNANIDSNTIVVLEILSI